MSTALLFLAWLVFFGTLPAVIELSLFLFANLFLRSRLEEGGSRAAVTDIDRIAILIPAHDEEKTIGRCVTSLLASDPGRFQREVIVIADNCSDRTSDTAAEAGARVIERFDEKIRGKGAALSYAIDKLADEPHQAYIVIDADSVVDKTFVRTMGEQFAEGKEALQSAYLVLNVASSSRTRLMNLALLSQNLFRPIGRELLGCSVGIMGNGFGLTKRLLGEVPYTANSITEDLEYHLKLIDCGRRVRYVPGARVLADFPVSSEGEVTQRARWEGGRFMLQRRFFPRISGRVLSGKLSMAEPLLDLMSLPLSYESPLLLLLALLPGQPFSPYGIFGISVIFLQMIAAVLLYGEKRDFKALIQIPGYIFWKIVKLPRILAASKKNTPWIRTRRD